MISGRVSVALRSVRTYHDMKLVDKCFVNGSWVSAKSGQTFQVLDPATCSPIGMAPDMAVEDVTIAVDSAWQALDGWKRTTAKERSDLLRRWFELLRAETPTLARLVTLEAGKCVAEAETEVRYGNGFVEWFAEEARRAYGEVVPSPVRGREMLVVREPLGVVGLIAPWNFPHAMITRKAAAALAGGCTCIIRPAEDTPFTALAIADIAERAGFPKGVINVVTSSRANAAPIGKFLCESERVAGISFTGSTTVGKLLYAQCALRVKRISLELGGNAPFVVFNTANIDAAVTGAFGSKFRNCGQTCVSANRFLIQQGVFNEFVKKLTAKMDSGLKIGDGKKDGFNLGPLINEEQVRKVESIVEDAKQRGATVVVGGRRAKEVGERFYEPTVLTGVTEEMRCYREEIFGPVVVCIPFKDEEEAVRIANNTERGLAGYFFTGEIAQAWRVAHALEVGMVGVNEGVISAVEAPFGGVKESGIGREGSKHGLDEFTNIKYICFGNL